MVIIIFAQNCDKTSEKLWPDAQYLCDEVEGSAMKEHHNNGFKFNWRISCYTQTWLNILRLDFELFSFLSVRMMTIITSGILL